MSDEERGSVPPEVQETMARLAADERQAERVERVVTVALLLGFALLSHSLGAPDAIVYNLTGGALTYALPGGGARGRLARVPVGLLVGTAAAGLSFELST